MSINRSGILSPLTFPSGFARRGGSGLYVPDLTLPDCNPYPSVYQGLDDAKSWQNVRLVSGRLHPTAVNGGPPFDDSIMVFPGTWGTDFAFTANVYRSGSNTAASSQEVEFLICQEIGPYQVNLYEIMISVHGTNLYTDIVRWNGPVGGQLSDFTFLVHETGSPVIANGDALLARKVGNTLSMSVNGSQIASGDIAAQPANPTGPTIYTKGLKPGIGFWQRGGSAANLTDFGLYNIVITSS